MRVALLCLSLVAVTALADTVRDWPSYGGDKGSRQYSGLSQINRGNVAQLKPAWTYSSARGAAIHPTSELQVNPLVVNGVLYGRSPNHNIFALNAASGEERWRYDPRADRDILLGAYMRGLAFWRKGDDARLLVNVANYLLALDANTGKPIDSFGDNGWVDLRRGLGRDPESLSIYAPSPGVVFEDLIIIGTATTESEGAAPGHIRAYNVRSGALEWIFHTIPQPGEFGHGSWPKNAYKTAGGANAWAGLAVDAARGLVFVPTGSPTPDFDGSRRVGANLFGNTLLALDARTGKRRWHYQTVHHDLWDRDLSSAPTLVSVEREGRSIAAVAQASKQGFIYLLNRETGEPIFPIEEVAVPASDVPGQSPWPTQPRVTLPEPVTRQAFTKDQITDINPAAKAYVTALYEQSEAFAFFRPIGLKPTILFPAFYGATNYGGGAFDPTTNTYFINAMEAAHRVKMAAVSVPSGSAGGDFGAYLYQKYCGGCHGPTREGFYPYAPPLVGLAQRIDKNQARATIMQGRGRMMAFGGLPAHEIDELVDYLFRADEITAAASTPREGGKVEYLLDGYTDFLDDRGYPAIKPPWGTLNAIDLNTGKRKWQVTLGEIPALTAEGVPPTGTLNYGGPVVTAGGLVFIAATTDEKIRAFDSATGALLWEYKLPAAGYATPAIYRVNDKQYVVIACGGGKLGTPAGDQYVAFALP